MVLQIRDLLYQDGFTIEGARKQIKARTVGKIAVPDRTRAVLEDVRKEVQELLQLVKE